MKKNETDDFTIIRNFGDFKYSDLLKEFVHPILRETDDLPVLKVKYSIGAHAWNASILREKSEEIYQFTRKEVSSLLPGFIGLEKLFDEMVKRKEADFSEFKNIFADFEITKLHGDKSDLTVSSTPA